MGPGSTTRRTGTTASAGTGSSGSAESAEGGVPGRGGPDPPLPALLAVSHSSKVVVSDLQLLDPAAAGLIVYESAGVEVKGLQVAAAAWDTPGVTGEARGHSQEPSVSA